MSMAHWEAASLKSSSRGEPSKAHKATHLIRAAGHKPTSIHERELGALLMQAYNADPKGYDAAGIAAEYIAANFGE